MKKLITAGQYLVLALASLILLFPVLYALLVSLQNASESVSYPPVFIPDKLHWQSYVKAMETAPVFRFIFIRPCSSAVCALTNGAKITASASQSPGKSSRRAVASCPCDPMQAAAFPCF